MSANIPQEEDVSLPEKLEEAPIPEHLEEASTEERIQLVQDDRARRYGQIIMAFILVGFSIGFVVWYAVEKADTAFLNYMAVGLMSLVFAGVGAAYAIFGLGRTVARRSK